MIIDIRKSFKLIHKPSDAIPMFPNQSTNMEKRQKPQAWTSSIFLIASLISIRFS